MCTSSHGDRDQHLHGLAVLAPGEREVARGVLEGKTNAEIAAARRRSVHTISNQLGRVFRKLGVSSRSELVALLSAGAPDAADTRAPVPRLSAREQRVVALAARGAANKAIAYELGVAVSTVSIHLLRAMRKLGVSSRAELIRRLSSLPRKDP